MEIFTKIRRFLAIWNEFISIPLGIILWYYSPQLLRAIDPTAATYDSGIFQIILFTVIQFLIYHGIAWVMLKITFPRVYDYFNNDFEFDFTNRQWQRLSIALFLYAQYFYAMVILSRVI